MNDSINLESRIGGNPMKLLRKWWSKLGQMMGEGEYLRYCEHVRLKHPERALPTPKEFYVSRLNEKYSRPNRCC